MGNRRGNEDNALREIRELERALEQAIRALRAALRQLREIEERFEND